MADVGMGQDLLPPPSTFEFGVVTMAMVIHFMTAILFAIGAWWYGSRAVPAQEHAHRPWSR